MLASGIDGDMCTAPWVSIAKTKKPRNRRGLRTDAALKRHRLRAWAGGRIGRRRRIETVGMASVVLRAIGPEVNGPLASLESRTGRCGIEVASHVPAFSLR